MRATGRFQVESFEPASLDPAAPAIETALPVAVALMLKQYDGEVSGRSATVFTAAFEQARGVGTYVAMESFEGSLNGTRGAFNFVHSASTSGTDRSDEHFAIVAASGTGDLASIRGAGGLAVDEDGTHTIWFDYELPT
ncbi:MAG TPA: DUF3224 domain-containing protein [Microbacterium sp.]|nr:DUF3224 domain-containing protein [Microbacterium sp.]